MTVEWLKASDELLEIAEDLINRHHHELTEATISFIFRSEAQARGTQRVWGQAQKISDKFKSLIDADFLIWVALDVWATMPPQSKRALVDHELCHCKYDNAYERATIRPHDIEEFREIIDRYGLWSADLETARPALEKAVQPRLPGIEKSNGGGVKALDVRVVGALGEEVSDAHPTP